MLRELKFTSSAVAKKDFLPALTHFQIKDGRVSAFNGKLALSSPISCGLDCKPKAGPMVQAIARCGETIQLAMTPAGKLSIKSGSFKAFIECITDEMPPLEPEGTLVEVNGDALLAAFKICEPFIGNDASRQWTNGLLLRDACAYATNNVCLIQYFIGTQIPSVVNIPRDAIREAIRINEPPVHLQIAPTSITLHYSDGRWIRSQLFGIEWPNLDAILDADHNATPLDESIFTGVDTIKPFTDTMCRVYIEGNTVRTHESLDEGGSYDIEGDPWAPSCYNADMFLLLKDVAKEFDVTAYPNPSLFFGENLRGAIIGLRL